MVLCSVSDVDATLREIARVLEPDGAYEFDEHVATEGFAGACQHVLTPIQRLVAGNCHLDRNLGEAIVRVFPGARIERYTSGPPFIRWRIRGSA